VSKVTLLSPQKKNPDRYNLFLDGEFFCGLDLDTIANFKLKVGQELDQSTTDKVFAASEAAKIYQRALDFLAVRPRSEEEVRWRLKEKIHKYKLSIIEEGPDAVKDLVDAVVTRLRNLNYLNDTEFVRWWIDQRTGGRHPCGFYKIQAELLQKGVTRSLINDVWHELSLDEQELCRQHFEAVVQKYDLDSLKGKKRLVDYLVRKGFGWGLVKSLQLIN